MGVQMSVQPQKLVSMGGEPGIGRGWPVQPSARAGARSTLLTMQGEEERLRIRLT